MSKSGGGDIQTGLPLCCTLDAMAETGILEYEQIRVGCSGGSGFIYIGQIRDIDYDDLDKQCRSMAQRLYKNSLKELKERSAKEEDFLDGKKSKSLISYEKRVQKYKEWAESYQPIAERKVVRVYPSCVDPVTILIIEGRDSLVDYKAEGKPFTMDPEVAEALAIEIYKGVCRDLVYAYTSVQIAQSEAKRKSAEANVERLEAWIRKNSLGLVDDPEGLILACRIRHGKYPNVKLK